MNKILPGVPVISRQSQSNTSIPVQLKSGNMSTRRSSRPRPTRLAAGNLDLQRNVSVADLPTDLNSMHVGRLRNWCQSLGLPSTVGRVALQNRLEAKRNTISSPNVNNVETTSGNTTQQQISLKCSPVFQG